jgi:hypothetical protein
MCGALSLHFLVGTFHLGPIELAECSAMYGIQAGCQPRTITCSFSLNNDASSTAKAKKALRRLYNKGMMEISIKILLRKRVTVARRALSGYIEIKAPTA